MMAGIGLYDHQRDAIYNMKNGCILCGGVGSGKSRTALAYYYQKQGGVLDSDRYIPMKTNPQDLYIITTARKRDTLDWEGEFLPFLFKKGEHEGMYNHTVVIDSWNNISKYEEAKDAFFIFDEQRVVGYGAWTKSFLAITKKNDWILLSATPGDCWMDYMPVFIANGFYKNKTQFVREHVIYSPRVKFPKIDRYVNTKRLIRLRDSLLVDMDFHRDTIQHHENIFVDYDKINYKYLYDKRWNVWDDRPMRNAAELCYSLRKLVNEDESRQVKLLEIVEEHPRVIVFYNFDYELEILRNLHYGDQKEVAEWNGHKHQEIPTSNEWIYLVQYTSGAEGWNCVKTDTIVFYSQNYSYKIMEQSSGRIDRLNTPFKDLYYYHLVSRAGIDLAISRAIKTKKKFNERKWSGWTD